ncbi:MAG: hypothetical protein R3Y52_01235 [Psittacicella sp.]
MNNKSSDNVDSKIDIILANEAKILNSIYNNEDQDRYENLKLELKDIMNQKLSAIYFTNLKKEVFEAIIDNIILYIDKLEIDIKKLQDQDINLQKKTLDLKAAVNKDLKMGYKVIVVDYYFKFLCKFCDSYIENIYNQKISDYTYKVLEVIFNLKYLFIQKFISLNNTYIFKEFKKRCLEYFDNYSILIVSKKIKNITRKIDALVSHQEKIIEIKKEVEENKEYSSRTKKELIESILNEIVNITRFYKDINTYSADLKKLSTKLPESYDFITQYNQIFNSFIKLQNLQDNTYINMLTEFNDYKIKIFEKRIKDYFLNDDKELAIIIRENKETIKEIDLLKTKKDNQEALIDLKIQNHVLYNSLIKEFTRYELEVLKQAQKLQNQINNENIGVNGANNIEEKPTTFKGI